MNVNVVHVDPSALIEARQSDRASILIARFNPPSSPEHVAELCAALSPTGTPAHEQPIRAIRFEPEILDSTALSLDALAPHTDGTFIATPPEDIILSCSVTDPGAGGATTLIPTQDLIANAPDWVVTELRASSYRFPMTYDGNSPATFEGPILTFDPEGAPLLRWRSDNLFRPPVATAHSSRAGEAIDWMHDAIGASEVCTVSLQDGDLIVIPNARYLHGRTALSPSSPRVVLRGWAL